MNNLIDTDVERRTERLQRLGILEEPLGYADGVNRYEFVGGEPTKKVDPTGTVGSTGGNFPGWNAPRPDYTPPPNPWPDNVQRPAAPAPGNPGEELKIIRDLAKQWNKGAPGWDFTKYECSEQASGLHDFLIKRGPWKYWDFQVIGASGTILQHHVVAVRPNPAVNNEPPWVLDPFHGPTCWNKERDVPLWLLESFLKKWPNPNKNFAYQPPPGTKAPHQMPPGTSTPPPPAPTPAPNTNPQSPSPIAIPPGAWYNK